MPQDPQERIHGGHPEMDSGQQDHLPEPAQHQALGGHQSLQLHAAEDAHQPNGQGPPVPLSAARLQRNSPLTQKKNYAKCYEYSRLIKHFSQWDYEF